MPGTFCGWDPSANAMQLVGNYLWELDAFFSYASNVYFKFVADTDWAVNWGDADQSVFALPLSGDGDADAANIRIDTVLNGKYRFRFNEETRAYSVRLISEADHDADGIPDAWEMRYGLDPTNAVDASAYADADTFSNYEEYLADTDPTDPDSWFGFNTLGTGQDGALILTWQGGTGSVQYLMAADPGPNPDWKVIYTNQPPTPIYTVVTNLPEAERCWFRLKAARPSLE